MMCDFRVDRGELERNFAAATDQIEAMFQAAKATFGDMVTVDAAGLAIPDHARPLTRMIARTFDAYDHAKAKHSAAV